MSGPALPVSAFAGYGDQLYNWLGTFWTRLYRDRQFLRGLQHGRALLAAQTYLDALERLALTNRHGNPVFHRHRWYPIVIRQSQRNTGAAVALRLGDDAVLGDDNGLVLGGHYVGTDFVSYPAPELKSGGICIVDNIVQPARVLAANTDFVYRDATLIFRAADDPFVTGNFAIDDVGSDHECVLWACNVESDADYVYKGIGYALGVKTVSSAFAKNVLNALWDVITGGPSLALFSSLLGAVYQIPTCISDTETVEYIGNDGLVITDKNVYQTDSNYAALAVGQQIHRGDSMDSRLRIFSYPFDTTKASTRSHGFLLREALTTLQLPVSMLPVAITQPITLRWDEVPVHLVSGTASAPLSIRFQLTTNTADDEAFWTSVEERCVAAGTTSYSCFASHVNDIVLVGDESSVIGRISPLQWYLETMAGPGTIIVWVAGNAGGFGDVLRQALPATARLLLVEAMTSAPDTYTVDATETAQLLHAETATDSESITETAFDELLAQYWV